jgi:GntR family transcriptional regulator
MRVEPRPLYMQARELLRSRIVEGTWPPGHYLPSEARLAQELRVSLGTIRKAMEELVEQGLLERLHGRGTRVTAQSSARSRFRFFRFQRADGSRFVPAGRILGVERRSPSPDQRELLGLSTRERVLIIHRERRDGDRAIAIERIAVPLRLFENLDLPIGTDLGEELYVLYQQQCGVTIMATRDEIAPDSADAETARLLDVQQGTPILRITRLATALDGTPAELRVSRSASLHYRVDLE